MADAAFRGLLADLKSKPIWLLWRAEPNLDRTKKPLKVPYYANGTKRRGPLDEPEDRQQLVTFEQAVVALERGSSIYSGIAIALGPDGRGGYVQGCDLDNIAENGLSDVASRFIRGDLAGKGYVEISPSGNGQHILGYGPSFATLGPNGTGIEAYSGKRFFTFTGREAITDSPCETIDLSDFVDAVLRPRHRPEAGRPSNLLSATVVTASTVAELRSALAHLRSDDRDLWIRMGMALRELGDIGRGIWIDWSQTSDKFDPRDTSRRWDGFNPHSTGYRAVFAEAQRMGWINPNSNGAQLSAGKTSVDAPRQLVGRSLDNITMRAIEWVWVGWIPIGYLTIFAGETGAGKSTIVADIAARISAGRPWPGESTNQQREPGRVLWLGSEDSAEEMTVPRLTACGANLSNIFEITGASIGGNLTTFSLQDDVNEVRHLLETARAQGRPFQMLVIDPITSYLPGQRLRKVDLNDAGQLRSILEPWLRLANEQNIAIVCVTHFSKDTSRSMLNRVLGSAAFAQTCRSLCAVVQQPPTEEGAIDPYAKMLMQVKGNLPEHPGGAWRFTTEKVEIGTDTRNNKPIVATRPDWGELDAGLNPDNVLGGSRGPVSTKQNIFGIWLKSFFARLGPEEWIDIENVLAAAVSVQKVVTRSWWNKHSSEFLEKRNDGGKWFCRPKNT